MKSFEEDVGSLYDQGLELIYFMRGSLSRDDMFELTAYERNRISDFIKRRLESEKEKYKNNNSLQMVY
jgi:hypothetical protein